MLLFIKSISYLRFHFQICIIFVFLILGSVEETDFHIEPEIALELAMAANYLDAWVILWILVISWLASPVIVVMFIRVAILLLALFWNIVYTLLCSMK